MSPATPRSLRAASVVLLAAGLLPACSREPAPAQATVTPARSAPVAQVVRPALQDVLETTPGHIIGVSYPSGLARYPGLAAQAQRFAEDARMQVLQAEKQRQAAGEGPFELSLEFQLRHESPDLVVLAVDGSSFTGGAHGTPLIQRWVWLPREGRMLTVADLFPQPGSWERIAKEVRGQLNAQLSQRLASDDVTAAERAEMMKTATAMIDGGTEPRAENFAVFEPVLDGDGRIRALRFVFPPYQVGAYAEGMRTVELPSARLVADVAPAYRRLFGATG